MCLMYQTLILSGLSGVLFFSFLLFSGLFPFGFPSLVLPFSPFLGPPFSPLLPPCSCSWSFPLFCPVLSFSSLLSPLFSLFPLSVVPFSFLSSSFSLSPGLSFPSLSSFLSLPLFFLAPLFPFLLLLSFFLFCFPLLPWWSSLLSPSGVFCWFPRFASSLVFVVLKVSNLLSLLSWS